MTGNTVHVRSKGKERIDNFSPLFTSSWTQVGGVPIHSVASEGPAGTTHPVIVLVHGLGLSHRYMMPVAEALAIHYPVRVPDLPVP